jgi:pyruvate,water dikinase
MDIEWAKDGLNNQLYIVQARLKPFTENKQASSKSINFRKKYTLTKDAVIKLRPESPNSEKSQEGALLQNGEIIVTDLTNPDWDPIMKTSQS